MSTTPELATTVMGHQLVEALRADGLSGDLGANVAALLRQWGADFAAGPPEAFNPCNCGYTGELKRARSGPEGEFYSVRCAECLKSVQAFTVIGLVGNWNAVNRKHAPAARLVRDTAPKCVLDWYQAKLAHVKAVDAYNQRLAFVQQHMPFGTSVEPEYQLMEEAERHARGLLNPMFEGLQVLLAEPEEK